MYWNEKFGNRIFFAHFQILIHGIVEVKRVVFFVSMQGRGACDGMTIISVRGIVGKILL